LGFPGDGLDVFSEPAGGWSGTLSESARLRASNGAVLFDPWFVGSSVVAVGFTDRGTRQSEYLFLEPAGGWRGVATDAARLVSVRPVRLPKAARSGPWVMMSGHGGVFVFARPRSGWHGTVHEVGFLQTNLGASDDPAEVSGRTALVGLDVFTEPKRGWTGTIRPSARIQPYGLNGPIIIEAFSGRHVAVSSYQLGPEHQCPCSSTVALAARPIHGWDGTVSARVVARPTTSQGPADVAFDEGRMFIGGAQDIPIYRIQGG
jgi:hypothetical protein